MADDSECLRSMSMAHFIAENYLSFVYHKVEMYIYQVDQTLFMHFANV